MATTLKNSGGLFGKKGGVVVANRADFEEKGSNAIPTFRECRPFVEEPIFSKGRTLPYLHL